MTANKRHFVKRFLLKAVVLYGLWQLLYIGFLRPNEAVDNFLTRNVIQSTKFGLTMIGFNTNLNDNVVIVNNIPAIRVENQCNGLELLALYIGFLICFPGHFYSKIVYSVVGSLIMYLVNVIRQVLLALNYVYFETTFELNHKYTYTIAVYLIVFLLWKHWIERYSIVAG